MFCQSGLYTKIHPPWTCWDSKCHPTVISSILLHPLINLKSTCFVWSKNKMAPLSGTTWRWKRAWTSFLSLSPSVLAWWWWWFSFRHCLETQLSYVSKALFTVHCRDVSCLCDGNWDVMWLCGGNRETQYRGSQRDTSHLTNPFSAAETFFVGLLPWENSAWINIGGSEKCAQIRLKISYSLAGCGSSRMRAHYLGDGVRRVRSLRPALATWEWYTVSNK